MKKALFALGLSALSNSSFAITNGTVVDWQNDFDDYVTGNCTGLIVGGNQILTAAHCSAFETQVFTHRDEYIDVNSKVNNPLNTGVGINYDVSILNIDIQSTQNIHFFADLNQATASVGDAVHIFGFAASFTELKRGDSTISRPSDEALNRLFHEHALGTSLTQGGDSGSAWFNSSDEVIGVHFGGDSITDLFYSKDFILETVNGWHYPTVLKGTGTQTVKIQSLHQNGVTENAHATGDVQILGGTCQTQAVINAFDTCTYELEVTGSGQLHLSNDEVIDINPVTPTPVPPPTTPSSGGSGGSLGFLSLFGLVLFARLKHTK
ncbi:serine protease [Vibrio sp. 10N.261.51.A1]|uniref:trypsin-like serine peptidase n=1 Tax=unclassified Vibrio TaxID=2614977 RepID=UPI00355349CE